MRYRSNPGFTLAEVAVAAALVAMLAAVTSPYLVSFLDRQRAQATADKLAAIARQREEAQRARSIPCLS